MRYRTQIRIFLLLILAYGTFPGFSSAGPEVETESFWTGKLSTPDAVILSVGEITELNGLILSRTDQMADIGIFPDAVSGESLLAWLLHDPVLSPENGTDARFHPDGREVKNSYFASLAGNMNLEGIGEINPVLFGAVVERADIRAFPSDEPLYKRRGAKESDTLQYSSVYPPEPVALLHVSKDARWGFFQTGAVRGWIRLDKVAFGKRSEAARSGPFIVVTGSMADVYREKGFFRKALSRVPMGTVLHLAKDKTEGAALEVFFPERSSSGALQWVTGYIKPGTDVAEGFLPYTASNAIKEAFKMLGEEYGWGGNGGRRDCSAFVKDVFATMGITLPRNSARQALAGDLKAGPEAGSSKDDMRLALQKARPGITLLALDGHIMLYIGTLDGEPYVVHQIAGYMDGVNFISLYRASVTGLDAGDKLNGRTFKDRLKAVTEVALPAPAKAGTIVDAGAFAR